MYELFWLEQTLFPMNKSWIDMPRNTPQYMDGLNKFFDFSFAIVV